MQSVKLVSVTPDAENTILYCARISSDQTNTNPGLLRYLIKHKHWSPFELAHMGVEITTSRAIAAQILRHRSFSFQEFSQRYADPTHTIKYEARRQAEKNRQSSIDDLDVHVRDWFDEAQEKIEEFCFNLYEEALQKEIARESARFLLPLSTETKIIMNGNLRSWIHYLELRCAKDTQLEHREIANQIKEIFDEQFPIIAEALKE